MWERLSSRDKRRQHGVAAIFAAESRSHKVKSYSCNNVSLYRYKCSVGGAKNFIFDNMLSEKPR